MRLEVDDETAKLLDEIKESDWSIQGKGHTETIRFLAKRYKDYRDLTVVIKSRFEDLNQKLPELVQLAQLRGLKQFLMNLVTFPTETLLEKVKDGDEYRRE